MPGEIALPPARERNRAGLRSIDENPPAAPTAREALLDRVEIRIRATVHAPFETSLEAFVDQMARGSDREALFGRVQRRGGRWSAKVLPGTTLSGSFTLHHRAPDAWLDLVLVVNPIRTLAHLLNRFSFGKTSDLDAVTFFAEAPCPDEPRGTLDGRDNMVDDFREFAGTVHATYCNGLQAI